jgi:hypothetical protein
MLVNSISKELKIFLDKMDLYLNDGYYLLTWRFPRVIMEIINEK